jgi:hypothetical protein
MAAYGVSAAGACALGGIAPAAAQEAAPVRGGTLRVAMLVKAFRDPRIFEWTEPANITACCNEYLVRWDSDFTFTPQLLESWEASDDAKTYTFNLRRGVDGRTATLHRRRRDLQPDPLGGCDGRGQLLRRAPRRADGPRHEDPAARTPSNGSTTTPCG